MSSERSEAAAPRIPLSVPLVAGREWEYVKECLDTGWVSSVGSFVSAFEVAMAEQAGTAHAVACVNGTAALQLALRVAGVEAEDEVIVPSLTFIAPANAARYLGAWPVFLDVEERHWQLDPAALESFLRDECDSRDGVVRQRATGRRVKAVVPVHILGHPCDMDPTVELARRYGLVVVEDASESLGGRYRGRRIGQLGDLACFSFNGNKIVTSGGGGMITTDREDWALRLRHLSTQAKLDPIEYVHDEVGYNYRLTNVQAAIGLAQLEQLDERVEAKRRIAASYDAAFEGVAGLAPMQAADWARSTYWLYTVWADPLAGDRRALMAALDVAGIDSRPLWQPLHLSPAFSSLLPRECPVADRIQSGALSLPCSPQLSGSEQRRVIDALLGAWPKP